MKFCIVVPCFNHSGTVAAVAAAALKHAPVIVVDDGSTEVLPELPGCEVIKLAINGGKGAALREGFARADSLGYSHVVTVDADGQHDVGDMPKFFAAAEAQPDALVVGVRDFVAAGAPAGRRRSNAFSNFWFKAETGVKLGDTQCGFRCYPVSLAKQVVTKSGRYAFELEFMVRAAWVGAPVIGVPVSCNYAPEFVRRSHFRPVVDFVRITNMNIGLVLQSWTVPQVLRAAWSRGEKPRTKEVLKDLFAENSGEPKKLAASVGLGMFFGVSPFWGVQMLLCAITAHLLRLNKAVALVSSNISLPPLIPFFIYGSLLFGHWLFEGKLLKLSLSEANRETVKQHFGEWFVGSLVLAACVGALGMLVAYVLAKARKRK